MSLQTIFAWVGDKNKKQQGCLYLLSDWNFQKIVLLVYLFLKFPPLKGIGYEHHVAFVRQSSELSLPHSAYHKLELGWILSPVQLHANISLLPVWTNWVSSFDDCPVLHCICPGTSMVTISSAVEDWEWGLFGTIMWDAIFVTAAPAHLAPTEEHRVLLSNSDQRPANKMISNFVGGWTSCCNVWELHQQLTVPDSGKSD